jgi:hypothetical protein
MESKIKFWKNPIFFTEFVELITGGTNNVTTITAHSINTPFAWPAGRVYAFINIFTPITYKFNAS